MSATACFDRGAQDSIALVSMIRSWDTKIAQLARSVGAIVQVTAEHRLVIKHPADGWSVITSYEPLSERGLRHVRYAVAHEQRCADLRRTRVTSVCTNEEHASLKSDPKLWTALALVGYQKSSSGYALEMRDCRCGSTLAKRLA